MFAYEIPGLRFSLPSDATVHLHRFVSVNSDSEGIEATASTAIVGASMNETAAGEVLEIADGLVLVEASAAITAGAAVYSDANGKVATSGTIVAGTAITAATASGQLVTVKIH